MPRHRQGETRHPRWERCRALWSALERPVCCQVFSRILALQSAAAFHGVTTGDDHVRESRAMTRLRTRTVSTKVTKDDYAMFEQLAGDQRVGEWVRDALFRAVLSERTAEAHRTILEEVLAPRKVLLNLQFTVAREPVTRD
jgi:hypothetical protein